MKDWITIAVSASILFACLLCEWNHAHRPMVSARPPVGKGGGYGEMNVTIFPVTLPAPSTPPLVAVSEDWTLTAERTARAALAGDAQAAWWMAQHAADCIVFTMPGQTPREALSTMEASHMPDGQKKTMRQRFDNCAEYFSNPRILADLPIPAGYYQDWATDSKYWADLAYQLREPHAIMQHDAVAISTRHGIDTVVDDVAEMVTTGTPAVLFNAGALIRSGIPEDSQFVNGAALQVAACRLGAANCEDFQTWAQTNVSADKYAAIDARAQSIVEAYRQGDVASLRSFARVTP